LLKGGTNRKGREEREEQTTLSPVGVFKHEERKEGKQAEGGRDLTVPDRLTAQKQGGKEEINLFFGKKQESRRRCFWPLWDVAACLAGVRQKGRNPLLKESVEKGTYRGGFQKRGRKIRKRVFIEGVKEKRWTCLLY